MTSARQRRKASPGLGLILGLVLALWLDLSGGIALRAAPADGGPVVVNPNTGLAISGFDPVAYFTDRKPVVGRPNLELRVAGAVWRFRNDGNKAAFADRPDVYAPRFGGYDPVAAAHGNSVPGHPLYWTVIGERLYLFYSEQARAAFLKSPGNIIARAERNWPKVARAIGR